MVGELLFKVSGISGKAEIQDETEEVVETATADSSKRALAEALGVERRDRILAALYLARQDSVNVVRQSTVHIWKALVSNTPRTGMDRHNYSFMSYSLIVHSTGDLTRANRSDYWTHIQRGIRATGGWSGK